jgi:hypothetical protein
LKERVDRATADLTLAKHLEKIRLKGGSLVGGYLLWTEVDPQYAAAFRDAFRDVLKEDPAVVAQSLSTSGVRLELLAALDDWAVRTGDPVRQEWCLNVARHLDSERMIGDPARVNRQVARRPHSERPRRALSSR